MLELTVVSRSSRWEKKLFSDLDDSSNESNRAEQPPRYSFSVSGAHLYTSHERHARNLRRNRLQFSNIISGSFRLDNRLRPRSSNRCFSACQRIFTTRWNDAGRAPYLLPQLVIPCSACSPSSPSSRFFLACMVGLTFYSLSSLSARPLSQPAS